MLAKELMVAAVLLLLALPAAVNAQSSTDADAEYSRKGADTCLACHQDEVTLAIFSTRHAIPSDSDGPFGHGQLQCEACHGPGDAHAGRVRRGQERPPAELSLILADGSVYPHKGKPDFIDRGVDPTTGAILVQASFPNPDMLLRPGLFARLRTQVDTVEDGILVPQRCVTELQGRFRVFVVDDQNKVQEREVAAGPTVGSFWLIKDGLRPGEKVVYEGLQKIGDGAVVKPVVTDVETTTSNGP